jgi:hypothetical protein
VHYPKGGLTRRQPEVVSAWRARLRKNRTLPDREPGSGPDDRPQASCPDVIAAAVRELLEAEPDSLVRYANASWQMHQAATSYGRNSAAAPVYPPVG